jgi:hypothetical protein
MSKPLLTGGNGKSNEFVGTANGQVPTWSTADGGQWFPGSQSSGGGGGELFYLNSGIAATAPTTNLPYTGGSGATLADFNPAQLSTVYDATTQTRTTPTLPSNGSWQIVQGFVTDAALNLTALPAGLFEFNIWVQASSGAGPSQTQMRVRVGKYDSSNVLTYLSSSDAVYIYDPTTPTQYVLSVVIGSNTLATTDRLYVEINATATVNGRTATFHFGAGEPSHVHTTIVVPINLADATQVTGILPTDNGGTGKGTGSLPAINTVFAGAASGSAALPTFRALVYDDIKTLIPYDLPVEIPGTPDTSTRVVNFKAVRPFRLAASGHQGGCAVANPSTNTSFTVQKNLSGTDTITFQSGGGFASSITQTDFAIGDLLTVETPNALNSMDTPFFTLAMTLL